MRLPLKTMIPEARVQAIILPLPSFWDVNFKKNIAIQRNTGQYWIERGEITSYKKNPNFPDLIRKNLQNLN